MSVTSITRLIVVSHFLRQALGTQTMPPNQVLIGLSLFLTYFIIQPVGERINQEALQPMLKGQISETQALDQASGPLRSFMLRYTREKDLNLFLSIAKLPAPKNREELPNHQAHLEAYVAVPSMGSILHTLNIRLFEADLAYIVEHAGDSVVIVDESLLPAWRKVAARVSCVRHTIVVGDVPGPRPADALDYETLVARAEPLPEFPDVPESQAAAMCYTSGTTGAPKGVVYSHRSNVLHSYAALMGDGLGLGEKEVVLAIVPMFHANAWGLPYACLMAGVPVIVALWRRQQPVRSTGWPRDKLNAALQAGLGLAFLTIFLRGKFNTVIAGMNSQALSMLAFSLLVA